MSNKEPNKANLEPFYEKIKEAIDSIKKQEGTKLKNLEDKLIKKIDDGQSQVG